MLLEDVDEPALDKQISGEWPVGIDGGEQSVKKLKPLILYFKNKFKIYD